MRKLLLTFSLLITIMLFGTLFGHRRMPIYPGGVWDIPSVEAQAGKAAGPYDIVPSGALRVRKLLYGTSAIIGSNTTSTVVTFAAPGAGLSNYVSQIICLNTSSVTVTEAQIQEAGVGIATVSCGGTSTTGAVTTFDPPWRGTVNTADGFAPTVAIASTYLTVSGFVGNTVQ